MTWLKDTVDDLLGLMYPNMCIGCMQNSLPTRRGFLCVGCIADLPFNHHFESPYNNELVERFYGRFPVHYAVSLFYFMADNAVQKMMHAFKYKEEKYIGQQLGKLLGENFRNHLSGDLPELLVPVPLHRDKLIIRGFNQSEIIATSLGEVTGTKVLPNALVKLIDTHSQTQMSRTERMENLKNVFAVSEKALPLLKGRHVLLIDDTVTTGATLESCARQLLNNGAHKVSVACIAMAK